MSTTRAVYDPCFGYGDRTAAAVAVASAFGIGAKKVLFPPLHTPPVAFPVGLWTLLFQNCGKFKCVRSATLHQSESRRFRKVEL